MSVAALSHPNESSSWLSSGWSLSCQSSTTNQTWQLLFFFFSYNNSCPSQLCCLSVLLFTSFSVSCGVYFCPASWPMTASAILEQREQPSDDLQTQIILCVLQRLPYLTLSRIVSKCLSAFMSLLSSDITLYWGIWIFSAVLSGVVCPVQISWACLAKVCHVSQIQIGETNKTHNSYLRVLFSKLWPKHEVFRCLE